MPANQMPSSSTIPALVQPRNLESLPSALLLDVRTEREFAEKHIPGSILLPLDSLAPQDVADIAARFSSESCAIICRSGVRSATAAQRLRHAQAAGLSLPPFTVLQGGIEAWLAAGLRVVGNNTGNGNGNCNRRQISLERQVRIGAGSLVLAGVLLSLLVHPAWLGLSGFVGAGLTFAGLTDFCGMAIVLAKMPWNR